MKRLLFPSLLVFISCGSPQKETNATDSISLGAVAADQPATSHLSFDQLPGFSTNSKTNLADTLNYFLLASADDLEQTFTAAAGTTDPDFLINYIVGIAGKETNKLKAVTTDSVRVNGSSIEVFVRLGRDEQSATSRPARLIAIEKRTDVISIRFFVNGIPGSEIIL